LRVIFLGTPEFAVPTLQALIDSKDDEVVGAVCQPDRPAGRGNKLHEPPIKLLAQQHDIPVLQPTRLSKSPETVEKMQQMEADAIVMVAFGQILKQPVLTLTKYGVINVHASLLPKYRGAAPINWAIIKGETKSGVTTMFTEAGVDTGPMLLKKEVEVDPDMTSEDLGAILSHVGAKLLIETLDLLRIGKLVPIRQDDSEATLAPMMSKETGILSFENPAQEIHNLVRGLLPWPCAHTSFRGSPLKILKTKLTSFSSKEDCSGLLQLNGESVLVTCGHGGEELIELVEVQPANRNRMPARSWAHGLRLEGGEELGS
jgi:methionyl-tRNA formyltransferase